MSDQTQNSPGKTAEEIQAECEAVCKAKAQEIQRMVDELNTNYQSVAG
jgi:hypothetical protein